MDPKELEATMVRKGKSKKDLIMATNLSRQTLYNKMHGISEFKSSEIIAISKCLDLSLEQLDSIFFDKKVN